MFELIVCTLVLGFLIIINVAAIIYEYMVLRNVRKQAKLLKKTRDKLEKMIANNSFEYEIPPETVELLKNIIDHGKFITTGEYNEVVRKRKSKTEKN